MSLPVIKNASFSIKIKEMSKPIKVRPMLLSEYKCIQAATDMNDDADIANVIADVTSSCTDGVINAKNVPLYVLNYVFLQIYMNSVENVVSAKYTCHAIKKNEDGAPLIDEETGDEIRCNGSIDVKIPLSAAIVEYPEDFDKNKLVKISDNVTLHLVPLSLYGSVEIGNYQEKIIEKLTELNESSAEDEDAINRISNDIKKIKSELKDAYTYYSVEKIDDNGNIMIPEKDFNQAEFIEWINNCPSTPMIAAEKFYEKTPDLTLDLKVVCPDCGCTENIKLRGLKDFFS